MIKLEQTQLNSIITAINNRAKLASPVLTGTPTAPTAAIGTNTLQLATTAFVLANAGTAGGSGFNYNTTYKRMTFDIGTFTFAQDGEGLIPVNKTLRHNLYNETATTFVVPATITQIFVQMWGAGGGGGAYGGWRQGSVGGAGGYSQGLINVTPGETITIRTGQRGYSRWSNNKAYPDGGGASLSGGDNQYAGSGGGSSSILVPSLSANWCMFAGAGGGGGSCNGFALNSGGAGGGLIAQAGVHTAYNSNTHNGKGGTQTAGGARGTGDVSTGGAGAYNSGGTHQHANNYGGGGGGGYYGGGSGAYNSNSSMGGGGGGSGFVHASILLPMNLSGNGHVPANFSAKMLAANGTINPAMGGEEDGYAGPGLVTIFY